MRLNEFVLKLLLYFHINSTFKQVLWVVFEPAEMLEPNESGYARECFILTFKTQENHQTENQIFEDLCENNLQSENRNIECRHHAELVLVSP